MGGYTDTSTPDISEEQTLAVVPTGIVDDPRCIIDLDQLGKKIVRAIRPIYEDLKQAGTRLKQIVVGGPQCLAGAIDEYTASTVHVTSHQKTVEQYLDDTGEAGDGYEIPAVRQDRPEIAALLAREGRLSEDSISEFDIDDAADRARITDSLIRKLKPRRYHRARQKAQSKRLEHLLNDWFDNVPTANHVLVVGDGRNTHQHLVNHAKGQGKWVKYPTACNGHIRSIELDGSIDGSLSWALAAIFDPRHRTNVPYHELTPTQQQHVQQWLSESNRRELGYPREVHRNSAQTETTTAGQQTASAAD
jgi:hypothetical protein